MQKRKKTGIILEDLNASQASYYAIKNINKYLILTKNMKTYTNFNNELREYKNRLLDFRENIDFKFIQ